VAEIGTEHQSSQSLSDPWRDQVLAHAAQVCEAPQRTRLPDLVAEVEDHLHLNGPWKYTLSDLYDEPVVTGAVEKIAAREQAQVAA
jgi:hypothetical protein